jgi:GxxExxY protein
VELNDISGQIVDAAMKVHTKLGPGMLEKTYEFCLAYELRKRGFTVETQKPLPLTYEEVELETGFVIDMLVENTVIVELKSVENILPVHEAQTLTYMKLSEKPLALLINFNVKKLMFGIRRFVGPGVAENQ